MKFKAASQSSFLRSLACRLWRNSRRLVFGSSILWFGLSCFGENTSQTYEDRNSTYTIRAQATGFAHPQSGFYPVQVEIENRGPTRTFEVSTEAEGGSSFQKIRLASGEQGRLLLMHPVVAGEGYMFSLGHSGFRVKLQVQGHSVEDFSMNVSYRSKNASVNTWWVGPLDGGSLDQVATALGEHWPALSSGSQSSGTSTPSFKIEEARLYFATFQPSEIPTSWMGLTTGDLLVCPWSVLASMTSERRTAIVEWVQSGGILLTFDAPEFSQASPVWRNWGGGTLHASNPTPSLEGVEWSARDLLGKIVLLKSNDSISPASAVATWLKQVTPLAGTYLYASTISPQSSNLVRAGNADRGWSCLTEKEVPLILKRSPWIIIGMLSGWVLLAFPFQYTWLRRRKRLGWLPVCTFTTSVVWMILMTNYGLITQGLGFRSIVRTWTWLDQASHRAVTMGYGGLVSGRSHSGLPLPEGGWILPSLPPNANYGFRHESSHNQFSYNWNSPYQFTGGWLVPRTLQCFTLRQVLTVRERLEIEPQDGNRLKVTNGLGTEIEWLSVSDSNQRWELSGKTLAPGETAILSPAPQAVPNINCWFPLDRMSVPIKDSRHFVAQIRYARWINLGIQGKQEEGTQNWVGGIW